VQPFASVGKFSLQLLGLPYQATIDPMCEMYTLGWYRPRVRAEEVLPDSVELARRRGAGRRDNRHGVLSAVICGVSSPYAGHSGWRRPGILASSRFECADSQPLQRSIRLQSVQEICSVNPYERDRVMTAIV
jgi:hypothetical protein